MEATSSAGNGEPDAIGDVNLYVTPASGKEAALHVGDSIAKPITKVDVRSFFDEAFFDKIASDEGRVFAWGARPGKRNTPLWATMKEDDYVLFYQSKAYTYVAQVIATTDNEDFASALWGRNEDGVAWRYVYFVTEPIRIDVPIERLSDYLQNAAYQSFVKIPDSKKQAILNQYGSVGEFVSARFINSSEVATKYFLLRRNVESNWDDGDTAYHFGNTVANWKKLAIGDRVVIDQKTSNGPVVVGAATIATIDEPDNTKIPREFYATLVDVQKFNPPKPVGSSAQALIRSAPGYNAQHSIRPISQDIYDLLLGKEASAPAKYSPLPAPNTDLRNALFWDDLRTSELVALFNRSRQIIFAGPPGTGKTFVAKALAHAATGSHNQRRIIQFHPSYAYEDFVEGIRPVLIASDGEEISDGIKYELRRGALRRFSESAASDPSNRYVLVIDEINRANVARVFGELLFCLEYRGESIELPYSGRLFYLPENLWILATMNTADRSIALLDAAFRRRFHQWTLEPDYAAMQNYFVANNYAAECRTAIARLRRLNDELLPLVGHERLVGQSFFLKPDLVALNFEEIWEEDLEPVLREHLYNRTEELPKLRAAFLSRGE